MHGADDLEAAPLLVHHLDSRDQTTDHLAPGVDQLHAEVPDAAAGEQLAAHGPILVLVPEEPRHFVADQFLPDIRITSYNVCYTKLLRHARL